MARPVKALRRSGMRTYDTPRAVVGGRCAIRRADGAEHLADGAVRSARICGQEG